MLHAPAVTASTTTVARLFPFTAQLSLCSMYICLFVFVLFWGFSSFFMIVLFMYSISYISGRCLLVFVPWVHLLNRVSTAKVDGLEASVKTNSSFFICLHVFHVYTHAFSPSLDIDAPTNLVTTEVTEDTATVSWDRVQAEIEGYMLTYTSGEASSAEIPVGRDSTSYRLIGLRPGVLHTVYIWAFKGDKVSRKSSTEAETGKL